jgi:hypothetical protein
MNVLSVFFGLSLLFQPLLTQASDVDWLIGCWESADGSSKEVWVKEPGDSLMGFGVALSGNDVVFYELLRVVANRDAALSYTAYPAGQSPTTFAATDTTTSSVVFSNAEHDYPQEIAYRLEGSNLNATISALDGKNPKSFDKQPCK